jgi:adenylate cyclase
VSTDLAQAGAPSDWSQLLRRDLLPRVQAIRERSAQFLAQSQDAPPVFRTDADRLDRASSELLENSRYLVSLGSGPAGADVTPLVRKARHALLNILNRVSGYSQLLLEAEEDEMLGIGRTDLERIYDLSRECERVIGQHLHPDRFVAPPASCDDCAPPVEREVVPGTILVADDDADIRSALVRTLQAQGHTLHEAADGQDALERLRAGSFDLVLLDITMPRMDGYEVLRQMRADPRLQSVPVLMVSALDEFAHTARSIEAGAEDFLPKPVDHVLLRARVNALLLRQQLRVRELEQFFPPEVARQLIDRPEVLEEGVQTAISVLFCDIRGYSRISRRLGPADTVEWVSSVMEDLTDCILRNNGVLVDFIGDELMSMWGAPTNQPNHADLACKTALEMFDCLPDLNRRWQERLGETMDFGVGINSGIAWVGNSGTRRKFKYGPSGDTVNVGSRVQGATKYLKAPLIVSRATHEQLTGGFASRRLARVKVVNIAEPVELFEVVRPGLPHWDERKRCYEEALELYEQRRLQEAAQLLGSVIATHGAAGPPLALMARVIEGLLNRDSWNAVFELPGK